MRLAALALPRSYILPPVPFLLHFHPLLLLPPSLSPTSSCTPFDMNAIDVNWCLNCACHIVRLAPSFKQPHNRTDTFHLFLQDGTAAYCSRECLSAHSPHTTGTGTGTSSHSPSQPIPIVGKPSSSSYSYRFPRPPPPPSVTVSLDEEDQDDLDMFYEHVPQRSPKHYANVPSHPQPSKSAWIGKGIAGIHAWALDVTPGCPDELEHAHQHQPSPRSRSSISPITSTFRPPKLLQGRRPTPTVFMSKTEPAPPVPSMPICTPQQSLPPLCSSSSHSQTCTPSQSQPSMTNASLTSLTTGISTSIATPASEDFDDPPSAETHRPNFIGTLTAHLASWASGSYSKAPASHYNKGLRSKTVTRRPEPSSYASKSQLSQVAVTRKTTIQPTTTTSAPRPRQRAYSPIPFFLVDVPVTNEKCLSSGWREKTRTEEHPAFKTRGRKPTRL